MASDTASNNVIQITRCESPICLHHHCRAFNKWIGGVNRRLELEQQRRRAELVRQREFEEDWDAQDYI